MSWNPRTEPLLEATSSWFLTANNLNNIFKHAYGEGRNHAVKLEQSNCCFTSDGPATYYKDK